MYHLIYQLGATSRDTYQTIRDAVAALDRAVAAQTDDCQSIWIERCDGVPLTTSEHALVANELVDLGASQLRGCA